MTKKQRKIFDSGVQRATGADIRLQDIRRAQKEKEKVSSYAEKIEINTAFNFLSSSNC
jgi:hypothetical protein